MVVVGLTLIGVPVAPLFQTIVPEQFDTINVAVCPLQMVTLFTVGDGFAPTVTTDVTVAEHPFILQVAV